MDEQSKESLAGEIKSANEVIEKLQKFATELFNNSGNNILTHLCDGLETFLGYDKESKGYDGSGIVYSDLDRLCDAVMGFLSGVLDAVKNENEVTTYDNYIREPNKKLNEVLETLTSSIGSGRAGLAVSVAEVREWLEGYEGKVKGKTGNVIIELSWLQDHLSGKYLSTIHDTQGLESQLAGWTSTLEKIAQDVEHIETNVNVLDDKLKSKLLHEIKVIKKSVQVLKESADNEAFKAQADRVDKQLVEREDELRRAINTQYETVRKTVVDTLGKINDEVSYLGGVKETQFANITRDVNAAKTHITTLVGTTPDGFKQKYETKILNHFDTINGLLKDVDKKRGGNGNSQLHADVEKISAEIKQQVTEAIQQLTKLEVAVKSTAKTAYDKVSDLVDKAVVALSGLDNKVKNGLSKLKNEVGKPIEDVINKLREGIAKAAEAQGGYLVIQDFYGVMDRQDHPSLRAWAEKAMTGGGLKDAIEKFETFKNLFGYFKSVLNSLAVNQNGGGIFYDALMKDLQKHVKDAIEAVKSNKGGKFAIVFNDFSLQIKNSGDTNETAYDKINKIKTDGEVATLDSLPVEKTALENAINLFEKDGESKSEVKEAIGKVLQKIKTLQAAPEKVTELKSETESLLRQLKAELDQLQSDIATIEKSVKSASDAFDKSIHDLNRAVSKAYHISIEAIENLKNELCDITRKAFRNVTNEVRLLFANGHQADLTALGNLVNQQKQTIEELIKVDRGNGVKGLLKWLFKGKGSEVRKYAIEVTSLTNPEERAKKLRKLSKDFKEHVDVICTYVGNQAKTPKGEKTPEKVHNYRSAKVHEIQQKLNLLLQYISDENALPDVKDRDLRRIFTFDHKFTDNLESLTAALSTFTPTKFGERSSPILQAFKDGISGLATELGKAYVNKYSGLTIRWEEDNPETTSCAKIFVTIMRMFGDDLAQLKYGCENGWKESKISLLSQSGRYNRLGNFLRNCGYVVTKKDGSQNGELQCSAKMIGKSIVDRFGITASSKSDGRLIMDTLESISESVKDYYETCHLSAWQSKTYPSSVYDMLRWLSGFTHNGVYETLSFNGFEELFEKPKEEDTITLEADGIAGTNLNALSLSAYPHDIKPSNLTAAFTEVCNHSHAVLTTILGHGHGEGVYACEFDTNSAGLVYPTDFNALVCMIRDVINRLYSQLHFLYQQCKYDTALGGWLDCEYGQGVGGSGWRCNVDQCANQACNQKGGQRANQNGNQKADQRCEQHPKCGVKSPLQSFLEDGLQGFLPHHLKSERGKLECSLKSHGNLPCITPMGFTGISQVASHRATGQRIVDVLAGYCGNPTSPLTRICGLFNCILPSAPKTLSDMFGFYYSFLADWKNDRTMTDRLGEQRETAFKSKVSEADFKNSSTKLDITSMFGSTDHKSKTVETSHLTGDLYSLVCCNPSTNSAQPCGAYLRPLCYDTCAMFSKEHADKYLSWIVYLTETFYTSLQKLLEDCQKTCGADSRKCKIGKCNRDCTTKEHPLAPSSKHSDACKSIVECGYIRPTFFRYGFIHDNVATLSGVSADSHKRTCTDFCTALGIVTKEGNALYDIVNKTIPEFLWTIRQNFFWTTVALWSLSLFYLICVMVGRLDVLHIRSHLRIPSSHKITAQSLLAAAQVGRLAKISYLQP